MADDLTTIVQRMIDAGESEENIATVIQGYQKPSDGPQFGDPSLHPTIGTITDDAPEEPSLLTRMGRNAFESAAHPQSAGDLLTLMIPAGVETASAAFKGYIQALKTAAGRAPTLRSLPKEFGRVLLENATAPRPILGFDPHLPNISSPPNAGVPQDIMPDLASPVDRYAPNVSSPPNAGLPREALALAPKQATYTKLDDGTFGIIGSGLKSGDSVHVMSRQGTGQMHTVGMIVSDVNGVQKATIGAVPKLVLTAQDVSRIQQLIGQKVPPEVALKTVLSLKQGATR